MKAIYYDGSNSRRHPVRVSREGNELHITGEQLKLRFAINEIRVPSRVGDTARSLGLPDGGLLHCDDNDAVDALFPGRRGMESLVHRLEQYWPAALLSVLVIVVVGMLFFTRAVPWIGDQAAQRLPIEAEQMLGRQVPVILEQLGMSATRLPRETRERLAAEFAMLTDDLSDGESYELRFARWRDVPNALALPGGTVIVTDELIELLDDDRLVVAVMAHEIGHLEHRHVMRSVAQSASVFVVLSLALGDVSAMSVLGAGLPAFLVNNHFSREFERQADEYAFELLNTHGRSPLDFAEAIKKLSGDGELDEFESRLHYLSTHPTSAERIEAARQASR